MANMMRNLVAPDALVVPVPLHWSRLLKRRYNQSALLAKSVAQKLDLDWCPDALLRSKRTRSLEGMRQQQRSETLEDAIQPHPKRGALLRNRPVLLIDDVMTTGATLIACTRACIAAESGPVRVLTLARAGKDA
jgi:predicted amidophosphoribosyltransferase